MKSRKIVILGGGFGGLFAARQLAKANAEITLIDRHNYHLFQPLLYQIAGAALAPSDVAWPIRSLLNRQRNTRVVMAEVIGIDRESRRVITSQAEFSYDFLVVATGSQTGYFGNRDWERFAPGLKTLADGARMREQILLSLERAETARSAAERQRLLTFVVIGGGPTGVELAGIIAELVKRSISRDFRQLDGETWSVHLIEGGERLLSHMPESLSRYAETALSDLGVRCHFQTMVKGTSEYEVFCEGQSFQAETILWCAGVKASPAGRWLEVETRPDGRIPVTPYLHLPEDDRVFVVGDLAYLEDSAGQSLPGLAPVAKQQGSYVGQSLMAQLSNKAVGKPFSYRDFGAMATIGRGKAAADFGRVQMKGRLTWWLWGVTHVYFLIGRSARLTVIIKWLWEYLTFQRGSRLIFRRSDESESQGDNQ